MRRREFIALVGAAAAWPVAARAQQSAKARRIAILHPSAQIKDMAPDGNHLGYPTFFTELRRRGHVEGQNLVVERYSALGDFDKHQELARLAVSSEPDVIFTIGTPMLLRLSEATKTIPIVVLVSDPLALGLAASLARPGGNVTGSTVDAGIEIWSKRLELLKQAAPLASRVAFLAGKSMLPRFVDILVRTAEKLGVELLAVPLGTPLGESEYRRVFPELSQRRADALIMSDESENYINRHVILELVAAARLPAIFPLREFVPLGGLLSYGSDTATSFRQMAAQVDQILRGAKVGDIPFLQPTKFALAVNLKTAKGLGITIPSTMLSLADEVIE